MRTEKRNYTPKTIIEGTPFTPLGIIFCELVDAGETTRLGLLKRVLFGDRTIINIFRKLEDQGLLLKRRAEDRVEPYQHRPLLYSINLNGVLITPFGQMDPRKFCNGIKEARIIDKECSLFPIWI